MDINEVLNAVEYGIKGYYNKNTSKKMNLLEYYSITDITPRELSTIAGNMGRQGLHFVIREYNEINYWLQKPLDLPSRLKLFYSVKGYELTPDDKIAIADKLKEEGFPLLDGIFDLAIRYYCQSGIESISKEKIRNDFIKEYNSNCSRKPIKLQESAKESSTTLVKQI